MDQTTATQTPTAMMAAYGGVAIIVTLAVLIFSIFIQWRIVSKAGYNGALSLLTFIPLVNFIVILLFAFMEWPVEKRAKGMAFAAPTGLPPGPPPPPPPSSVPQRIV